MTNAAPIARRTVESLKAEGEFFQAGVLAHALGHEPGSYGCHYGMRSTRESAIASFRAGYQAGVDHERQAAAIR